MLLTQLWHKMTMKHESHMGLSLEKDSSSGCPLTLQLGMKELGTLQIENWGRGLFFSLLLFLLLLLLFLSLLYFLPGRVYSRKQTSKGKSQQGGAEIGWNVMRHFKKKKETRSFLYQKGSFWKLPQIIALSTFASQRVASHCTQHWITFCSAMRRKWDGCKGTGIWWFNSCTREGNRWV